MFDLPHQTALKTDSSIVFMLSFPLCDTQIGQDYFNPTRIYNIQGQTHTNALPRWLKLLGFEDAPPELFVTCWSCGPVKKGFEICHNIIQSQGVPGIMACFVVMLFVGQRNQPIPPTVVVQCCAGSMGHPDAWPRVDGWGRRLWRVENDVVCV